MRRCLGCFENIKDELDICPFCGYVVGTPAEDEKYLEPGTLLSGRYLIGKVLRKDYVGVVYTSWDKSSNMKVAVREYLPEDCSTRLAGSQDVVPIGDDNKKQFDEGFNDFVAEAKRLFAGGGKLKLFDCIAENGTAYMIMESPDKKKPPVSVKKETVPATPAFAPKKAAVPTPKPPKSEPINVIKAEKKDNVGYNLSRKISLLPTWVKVVVPTVIVLGAVAAVLISNGVLDSIGKKNATETTEEPIENQITIPAEVFTWGYHSYACFDHCEKWEEAEEYCEALGGHLAVITSQEENDVILTYIQARGFDNVYIGYSDSEIEGVWRWVNGERSDYTNWNEGEPNAFTNDEDYAVFTALSSGAWNDSDYSPRVEDGSICFMCEWESVVTGESNVTYEELQEELRFQEESNVVAEESVDSVPEEITDLNNEFVTDPYNSVMSLVDENESVNPGSVYAIDLRSAQDEYYWFLAIQCPDGNCKAYRIDNSGSTETSESWDDYSPLLMISYEDMKSLPCLTYVQNYYDDYTEMLVSNEHPDGSFGGTLIAISDDCQYAVVSLCDYIVFSQETVNSLSVGDSVYIEQLDETRVVQGFYDDGSVNLWNEMEEDYPLYISNDSDGVHRLRTYDDDAVLINRRFYSLRLSDDFQFTEDPYFAYDYPDEYDSYTENAVSTGNSFLDSFLFYRYFVVDNNPESLLLHTNGYYVLSSRISAEISNGEIVQIRTMWHP